MASTINASTSAGLISTGDTSGVLALQTNSGTTAVTIDTSQNVGIGTTSPAYKVDIQNAGNFSAQLKATAGNYAQWSIVGNAGTSNFGTDNVGGYAQTVGAIPFLFYTNNTERMRIDSSGNVGIGTSSPTSKLTLSTGDKIFVPTGQALNFGHTDGTTNTERMRIDSSGNLLVGFTAANAGTSQAGSIQTGTGANVASQYTKKPFLMADYSISTAGIPQYVGNGPGPYWSIGLNNTTNSDIRIGLVSTNSSGFFWSGSYPALFSGAYTNASDYRIKENINTYSDGALNQILALRPVIYKIKNSDHTKGEETITVVGKEEIGFIAHEVQEVIPLIVTGTKDEVDSNGNEVHQGVDYTRLTAVLTKAIQELKALVDAQATEIAELKAKVGV